MRLCKSECSWSEIEQVCAKLVGVCSTFYEKKACGSLHISLSESAQVCVSLSESVYRYASISNIVQAEFGEVILET